MVVIGVTGQVGTGKSTVAKMFEALGAMVLDADAYAHEAMEPKRLAWRRIVEAFGNAVLNDDQTINRRALGQVVFADAAARERLEGILHPQVLRRMKSKLHTLKRRRGLPAIVLDIPLLFEVGAEQLVDWVVVVTAPEDVQQERLKAKYGWSDEEVAQRISAQWALSDKAALADAQVDNGNGLEHTRTQVKQLWQQAQKSSPRKNSPR